MSDNTNIANVNGPSMTGSSVFGKIKNSFVGLRRNKPTCPRYPPAARFLTPPDVPHAVTLEQLGTPPGAQPCIFIICGAHGYSPQEIPQAANLNSLN